jgi:hypothetical protein
MSDIYRGSRCPLCFNALYDGDWCQGPTTCANSGKPVKDSVRLSNAEAISAIDKAKAAGNYPIKP